MLVKELDLNPDDVESRSMGAGGEDLMFSSQARKVFPYSVECKNQESLNVWKSYEQAQANSGVYEPLLVIKKNRKQPLIVMDAKYFVELTKEV